MAYNMISCQKAAENTQILKIAIFAMQGGITCGAIDEPRKSSKAIDKRVIINFRDKNVIIARFRNKNYVYYFFDKMS